MSSIAHLSDLHFGAEDPRVADALFADLDGTRRPPPSAIAVSGDLTQRGRDDQLRAARAFLDELAAPVVVVPGNHDVPLYDVARRFTAPFARYRRHIEPTLAPTLAVDGLAIAGINTAHGFTVKGGRVTREQAERAAAWLARHPTRWKIVVAHHPFVVASPKHAGERVRGADEALPVLRAAGVDLILTGHLHVAHMSDLAGFRSEDRRIIAVHAGSCMSTRLRGEANGYNWLTIAGDEITIVHRVWNGQAFVDGASKTYRWAGAVAEKVAEHVSSPVLTPA